MRGQVIAANDEASRWIEILASIPGVAEVTAIALRTQMPELVTLEPQSRGRPGGPGAGCGRVGKVDGYSFIRDGRSRARRGVYISALATGSCNQDLAPPVPGAARTWQATEGGLVWDALAPKGLFPAIAVVAALARLAEFSGGCHYAASGLGCGA